MKRGWILRLAALTAGIATAGGLGAQGTAIAADQGLQHGSVISAGAQDFTDPQDPDGDLAGTAWSRTPAIADYPCGLSYALPPPTGVTNSCSAVLPTGQGTNLLVLGRRTTSTWLIVSPQH
jgi:hypothetical protein